MLGGRFDTGGTLARARPVLTFATDLVSRPSEIERLRGEALDDVLGESRSRADTPTPPPVTSAPSTPLPSLPIVRRIVRRTMIDRCPPALRPVALAATAARRSAMPTVVALGLALAVLGAATGLTMRSLFASGLPAAAAEHASDAIASERVLARATSETRAEGARPGPPVIAARPPAPHAPARHALPATPHRSQPASPRRPAPRPTPSPSRGHPSSLH